LFANLPSFWVAKGPQLRLRNFALFDALFQNTLLSEGRFQPLTAPLIGRFGRLKKVLNQPGEPIKCNHHSDDNNQVTDKTETEAYLSSGVAEQGHCHYRNREYKKLMKKINVVTVSCLGYGERPF
jgi:hypothetical protein